MGSLLLLLLLRLRTSKGRLPLRSPAIVVRENGPGYGRVGEAHVHKARGFANGGVHDGQDGPEGCLSRLESGGASAQNHGAALLPWVGVDAHKRRCGGPHRAGSLHHRARCCRGALAWVEAGNAPEPATDLNLGLWKGRAGRQQRNGLHTKPPGAANDGRPRELVQVVHRRHDCRARRSGHTDEHAPLHEGNRDHSLHRKLLEHRPGNALRAEYERRLERRDFAHQHAAVDVFLLQHRLHAGHAEFDHARSNVSGAAAGIAAAAAAAAAPTTRAMGAAAIVSPVAACANRLVASAACAASTATTAATTRSTTASGPAASPALVPRRPGRGVVVGPVPVHAPIVRRLPRMVHIVAVPASEGQRVVQQEHPRGSDVGRHALERQSLPEHHASHQRAAAGPGPHGSVRGRLLLPGRRRCC